VAAGERGSAMTETALLCFFIYGPILMMVLILGDISLERIQGQMASAYLAWTPESVSSDQLRQGFFSDAGSELGTGTIYTLEDSTDESERAPDYYAGQPTGGGDLRNVWEKLVVMAQGEGWSHLEWDTSGETPQLVSVVEFRTDSDARYLIQNDVVNAPDTPRRYVGLGEDANISYVWPSPSERALVVTALLNQEFDAGSPSPLLASRTGLSLWHTSVFFDEMNRFEWGRHEMDLGLPRDPSGRTGIYLRLGEATGSDAAQKIGKTWLFNPQAKPSGSDARRRLYELAPELFSHALQSGVYVTLRDMESEFPSTVGANVDEQRPFEFVEPGDPRTTP
jgi:hypothetical protein